METQGNDNNGPQAVNGGLPAVPTPTFQTTNLDRFRERAGLASYLESVISQAEQTKDPGLLFKNEFLSGLHCLQREQMSLACELIIKVHAALKAMDAPIERKQYQRAIVQNRPTDPTEKKETRLLTKDYFKIAGDFLAQNFPTIDGVCPLVFFGDDYYLYDSIRYTLVSEGFIAAMVWPWLSESFTLNEMGAVVPFNPNSTSIQHTLGAIKAKTLLEYPHGADQCEVIWRYPQPHDPNPRDLCILQNGIYNTASYALGPHTARLFCRSALPFYYDPQARCDRWLRFMDEVFERDPERILALQQFIGYLLIADNRLHKGLLCYGASRSGKSTIQAIISAMIGPENTCAPSLHSLGESFPLEDFIGKRVALVSDAHLGTNSDARMVVEAIKKVSGNDPQSVKRKNKTSLYTRLHTRMVIAANELPSLPDASKALLDRLIFLTFNVSFSGREDVFLEAQLLTELPGIFLWAVNGLYELRKTWRIVQPAAGMEDMREFAQLSNPVGAFLVACCDIGENYETETNELYTVWKQWAALNEAHPGGPTRFGMKLRSSNPMIRKVRLRDDQHDRAYFYSGVRLKGGLKLSTAGPQPASFGQRPEG